MQSRFIFPRSSTMALSIWLVACLALLASPIQARVPPAFQQIKQVEDNDVCSTCKVAMHLLSDLLCDDYVEDTAVAWAIENVCSQLQDKKQCADIIKGLAPALVQWVRASASPETMCQSAGVCGKAVTYEQTKKVSSHKPRNDMVCPLCMMVVTQVKAQLADPVTQEEIREKSMQACAALPAGMMQDTCMGFVEQWESTMFEFINTLEPADMCQMLGTCVDMTMANALSASPLSPEAVAAMAKLVALLQTPPANDKCETCKVVVMEVHQVLANPDIQMQIVAYAKEACNLIQTLSAQCQADVDQYAPMVFGMALAYLQPDQVCAQINMCPPPSFGAVLQQGGLKVQQGMLAAKYDKFTSVNGPLHA